MGKFSGVFLASDFDGTLSGYGQHINKRNVGAIEYFIEEGGLFTVATGRALGAFLKHSGLVKVSAPVILSNGALIYDTEKNVPVKEYNLPMRVMEDCLEITARFPTVALETYNGPAIAVYNMNEVTKMHLDTTKNDFYECEVRDMPLPWNKALFEQNTETLIKVKRYIEENFGEYYEIIFSHPLLLEMTGKNIHKGNAVKLLAEKYGINPENIFCAGDNYNDIPMLELSRIPFVPKNAAAEIKNISGAQIVASCEDGAIADAINFLDTIY